MLSHYLFSPMDEEGKVLAASNMTIRTEEFNENFMVRPRENPLSSDAEY